MTGAITVLGSGPSRKIVPHDMTVAGVSSGYLFADTDLFITVDKARQFPKYDGKVPVHVPGSQYYKGWNPMEDGPKGDMDLMFLMMTRKIEWAPGWADFSNVHAYQTSWEQMPTFGGHDGPIGLGRVMNSLIFAVQVLDRLGYRRLHFAGCDVHELAYAQVVQAMEWMTSEAKNAGHEWTVTTEYSRLSQFMPVDQPEGYLPIEFKDRAGSMFAEALA